MAAVGALQDRVEALERRVFGAGAARVGPRKAADGLVKVQVALGNITSKRERIKILYKKIEDLTKYLDPQYIDRMAVPDAMKLQFILAAAPDHAAKLQRLAQIHMQQQFRQSEFITSNKSKIMQHRMYQHLHADIRTMFDGMLHTAKEIMEKSYTPGEIVPPVILAKCQTYELGRTEGRPSLETFVLFFCKPSSYYFTGRAHLSTLWILLYCFQMPSFKNLLKNQFFSDEPTVLAHELRVGRGAPGVENMHFDKLLWLNESLEWGTGPSVPVPQWVTADSAKFQTNPCEIGQAHPKLVVALLVEHTKPATKVNYFFCLATLVNKKSKMQCPQTLQPLSHHPDTGF
ncbi:unnamed protein product [Lepidochelys olivacea]